MKSRWRLAWGGAHIDGSTKGCAEQLESLQVDVRWAREALKRGKASLSPGEESEELSREFTQIANSVEGLGLILERLKSHVGEFQETCTNKALQRVKQTSTELREYTREFLHTLNKSDLTPGGVDNNKTRLIRDMAAFMLAVFMVSVGFGVVIPLLPSLIERLLGAAVALGKFPGTWGYCARPDSLDDGGTAPR